MAARRPLTDAQREARTLANSSIKVTREQERAARGLEVQRQVNRTDVIDRQLESRKAYESHRTSELASRDRNEAITGAVAKQSGGGVNNVFLIMFTIAGLIIVYALVTNSGNSTGFFGRLGDWFANLSTNAPLFEKISADTTTAPPTTGTRTSGGGTF